jgi:hypothetical protein
MLRYERSLLDRQTRLQARAAAERERIASSVEPLRPYLTLTDRAVGVGRAVRAHPEWIAVGAAAITIWKPKKVLRAGRGLWVVWRTVQTARGSLRTLLARLR